jgi:hypothetical protein
MSASTPQTGSTNPAQPTPPGQHVPSGQPVLPGAAARGSSAPPTPKRAQGRGISYPFINLEEAVVAARKFYQEERKSAAPVAAATKHFGYAESSSGGRQMISALLQFGLLEDEGRNEHRHVKLTDRALTILLAAEDSPDRIAALRECARMPKIYAELLNKWVDDLPSDSTLSYYLLKTKDFNPKMVSSFIKDFRKSLAYAGTGPRSSHPQDLAEMDDEIADQVEVGDAVQWESNGVLQFSAPRRVVSKIMHEGQWWAQVEGSGTGIPLSELTIAEKGVSDPVGTAVAATLRPTPPVFSVPTQPGAAIQPVAGEKEWMRGRLSKETDYRLLITGEIGSKEIGRLIKLLEAQKLVLDEDAADELA